MSFKVTENNNSSVSYGKVTDHGNTLSISPYTSGSFQDLSSSQKNRVLLVKRQQQKILGLHIQKLTEKLNKEQALLKKASTIIPICDYTTGLPIEEHTDAASSLNPQSASSNKNEGGLRKKIGKLNTTLAEQNKKIRTLSYNIELLQSKLAFLSERANSILVTLRLLQK